MASRELLLRCVSSAVILPPVILLFWAGGAWFLGAVVLIAALMAREWTGLAAPHCPAGLGWLAGLTGAFLVMVSVLVPETGLALALLAGLPLVLAGIVRAVTGDWTLQLLPGLFFAFCPAVAILWVREMPVLGLETALWLVLSVIVTDIAAYGAGRTIGGPKLWARVSPNKTWAGLLGGMAGSAAFGALFGAGVEAASSPVLLALGGALIAIVAQMGDFGESALKRAFGAKDSGTLIPGHGGILDRVDGQITVLPVAALLMQFSGKSILLWSLV